MRIDAKAQKGKNFVDADGDGYNDNAPDHDGDGIPNGLDDDFLGAGKKGFVDLDGDGINDNAGMGKGKSVKNSYRNSGSLNDKDFGPQSGNVNGAGNSNNVSETGSNGRVQKGRKGKGSN